MHHVVEDGGDSLHCHAAVGQTQYAVGLHVEHERSLRLAKAKLLFRHRQACNLAVGQTQEQYTSKNMLLARMSIAAGETQTTNLFWFDLIVLFHLCAVCPEESL